MLAEFGSWIWGTLDTHMESSKGVTFIDTPNIQVKVSMNVMALASSSSDSIQESGVFYLMKEVITWILLINIKSVKSMRHQQEQHASAETVRSAWRFLPLDMECLQLGKTRRIETAPACKMSRKSKLNNSRKVVETNVEYYDSLGIYASMKWDNPVLQMDSLVEMVEIHTP